MKNKKAFFVFRFDKKNKKHPFFRFYSSTPKHWKDSKRPRFLFYPLSFCHSLYREWRTQKGLLFSFFIQPTRIKNGSDVIHRSAFQNVNAKIRPMQLCFSFIVFCHSAFCLTGLNIKIKCCPLFIFPFTKQKTKNEPFIPFAPSSQKMKKG